MSRWIVGDVQGCGRTLEALLSQIGLGTDDELWLAGDLVNRGTANARSLQVAMDLDAKVVLGNHDLYALGRALRGRKPKRDDTLNDIVERKGPNGWVEWMRALPLYRREGEVAMVHAGFLPEWSEEDILRRAGDVSKTLATSTEILDAWLDWRHVHDGPAFDARVLTCIRMVDAQDRLARDHKAAPEEAPPELVPWYRRHPGISGATLFFGHWAALGHRKLGACVSLDSGAVWGRHLTAYRAEDGTTLTQLTDPRDLDRPE